MRFTLDASETLFYAEYRTAGHNLKFESLDLETITRMYLISVHFRFADALFKEVIGRRNICVQNTVGVQTSDPA